jgi:iron(III) transport system ATP-binding protein
VRLRQEIRSLQRKLGVTTIMVTHDQEEALSVADRIVVMKHGAIEQVGTPMDVYRDPSSLFVADFVGRINALPALLEASGRVRIGTQSFECAPQGGLVATGPHEVKIYLRPEDVLARPIAQGDSNVFDAEIDKIEFMGSFCLVRVKSAALGEHKLTVYLSLNFLAEQRLEVGGRLPLRLLPERMRVFH